MQFITSFFIPQFRGISLRKLRKADLAPMVFTFAPRLDHKVHDAWLMAIIGIICLTIVVLLIPPRDDHQKDAMALTVCMVGCCLIYLKAIFPVIVLAFRVNAMDRIARTYNEPLFLHESLCAEHLAAELLRRVTIRLRTAENQDVRNRLVEEKLRDDMLKLFNTMQSLDVCPYPDLPALFKHANRRLAEQTPV